MEQQKWIIGKEYEFSEEKDFSDKKKCRFIGNNEYHQEGYFYIGLDTYGNVNSFPYIREIQQEVIEPRFIETDVAFKDNKYYTKIIDGLGGDVLISSAISCGAIGFKFEGSDNIYNSHILYNNNILGINSFILNNSKIQDYKVLRANKVVWLNPKYKE